MSSKNAAHSIQYTRYYVNKVGTRPYNNVATKKLHIADDMSNLSYSNVSCDLYNDLFELKPLIQRKFAYETPLYFPFALFSDFSISLCSDKKKQ